MKNAELVIRFFNQLIVSVLLVFVMHLLILYFIKAPLFEHKIISAYSVNFILAVIIFLFLFIFRFKYKDQLGFLYMAGSFLKFILFFILFYPAYKADAVFSSLEFFAFFTPYLTCLLIETLSLIKLLNSPEQNQ